GAALRHRTDPRVRGGLGAARGLGGGGVPAAVAGGGRGLGLSRQSALDDLQREEVLTLLAQDPAQALDVVVVELSVARGRALGVEQALALEESDLRDRDVGELVLQQRQDLPDRQER